MLGYALLAVAYWRGIGKTRSKSILLAWLLVILYAATDEFHQRFTPGRNARVFDVGIDAVGGGIGLIISVYINRIRSNSRKF